MRPSSSPRLQSWDDEGQQQQVLVKRPVVAFTSSPSDEDPHQCVQAQNHHQCLPARSPRQSVEQTRWSPLEARWDHSGTVWWPPVSLEAWTQVAFTCQHCQTPPHSLTSLSWLGLYTNTLCFLSTICCAQSFLVSVEFQNSLSLQAL